MQCFLFSGDHGYYTPCLLIDPTKSYTLDLYSTGSYIHFRTLNTYACSCGSRYIFFLPGYSWGYFPAVIHKIHNFLCTSCWRLCSTTCVPLALSGSTPNIMEAFWEMALSCVGQSNTLTSVHGGSFMLMYLHSWQFCSSNKRDISFPVLKSYGVSALHCSLPSRACQSFALLHLQLLKETMDVFLCLLN